MKNSKAIMLMLDIIQRHEGAENLGHDIKKYIDLAEQKGLITYRDKKIMS